MIKYFKNSWNDNSKKETWAWKNNILFLKGVITRS